MIYALRNNFRHTWENTHPFLRFLILAFALAFTFLFIMVPGYRLVQNAMVEKNVSAANAALKEGEMLTARDLSLAAIHSGESSIQAYRILEQSMAALRDPRHSGVARLMILKPDASDDDRLRAFSSLAPGMPMGLLGASWLMLPPKCRLDVRFVASFADRLISEKLFNKASSVLQAVPEAERTVAIQTRLIRLMIQTGEAEIQNEAQRWLSSRWPEVGEEMACWLDLVEEIPISRLSPHLLNSVRWKLESPEYRSSIRHCLALARIRYAADFPNRNKILAQAVASWKNEAPEAVAKLLVDTRNDRMLIDMLTPEVILAHPELFTLQLDTLERSGNLDKMKALLESQVDILPKFESQARLAVVSNKEGDETARSEHWKAAINDAKFSTATDSLLVLHRIASGAGMTEEAEEAMVEAILRGRGPLPFFQQIHGLIESLSRKGLEELMLRICTTYLWFEPGDHKLVATYIYLACLNDLAEPQVLLKAVNVLSAAFPEDTEIQCVHAMIHLYAGQPGLAAEILNRLNADPNSLASNQRAILLTSQVMLHQLSPKDPKITGFPWKALLPSERKKFGEWIKLAEESPAN